MSNIDNKKRICPACRIHNQLPTITEMNQLNETADIANAAEKKQFSKITQMKRTDFIKPRLIKKIPLGAWQPIPITNEDANNQKADIMLTKPQLLSVINSLIPLLNDLERSRFRGLANKFREDLMNILRSELNNIIIEF